jgi:hypothetical protein
MSGQVVLADGGPCVLVVFGCNLKGAYGQANCRTDSGGGGYAGTIECNYLEQDPSVGDDALVDLRCADGFVVANNGFMNGQFSASSSIGNAVSITRNILLYSNVYRANALVKFTGWCQFKPRLAGLTMALEDYGPGHNPYDDDGATDVVSAAA